MAGETWKDVPGYEGLYQVSDMGWVRSLDREYTQRSKKRKDGTQPTVLYRKKGWVLRPGQVNRFGHQSVSLGKRNSILVHSLVMGAFVGPRPEGFDIRHLNGDARDNRLSNLAYSTRSDNNRDCVYHGSARLSVEEVQELRNLRARGVKLKDLSARYGICRSAVGHIVRRTPGHYDHVR